MKPIKFTSYTNINKPIKEVAQYFIDPQYLGEYQEGFLRKELITGIPAENGTVSKMYYKMGKNVMELTETILDNDLPGSFEGHYHHIHMDNTMKVILTPISDTKTKYETIIEYTRIDWIMPRLMFILFRGMYKKQSDKWMMNFKTFVEKQ